MTQQYISGELSVLLARLQAVAADGIRMRNAARLRQEAETRPLAGAGQSEKLACGEIPRELSPQEADEIRAFGHVE